MTVFFWVGIAVGFFWGIAAQRYARMAAYKKAVIDHYRLMIHHIRREHPYKTISDHWNEEILTEFEEKVLKPRFQKKETKLDPDVEQDKDFWNVENEQTNWMNKN